MASNPYATYSPFVDESVLFSPVVPAPQDYIDLPSSVKPTEPTFLGEVKKGFSRSVDETQALVYGATGLLGDLIGSDTIRDMGYAGYLEQMEQASVNAPAVGSTSDIKTVGDFFNWVGSTAGSVAPTILASAASGGVGAGIAKSLGQRGIVKYVSSTLAKNYAKRVAAGIGKKEALAQTIKTWERTAIGKAVKSQLPQLGAMTGVVGFSSAIESGGNWIDDFETNGDGTNPLADLLFGTASGLTDIIGGEGMAIRKIFGPKVFSELAERVGKETAEQVEKGFATTLAKEAMKSSLAEGSQEAFQESLSVLNSYLNTHSVDAIVTPEIGMRLFDAAAAGAIAGGGFGGIGGVKVYYDAKQEGAKIREDMLAQEYAKLKVQETAIQELQNVKQALNAEREQINRTMAGAMFAPGQDPAHASSMFASAMARDAQLSNRISEITKLEKEKQESLALDLEKLKTRANEEDSVTSSAFAEKKGRAQDKLTQAFKEFDNSVTQKISRLLISGAPKEEVMFFKNAYVEARKAISATNKKIEELSPYASLDLELLVQDAMNKMYQSVIKTDTKFKQAAYKYAELSQDEIAGLEKRLRELSQLHEASKKDMREHVSAVAAKEAQEAKERRIQAEFKNAMFGTTTAVPMGRPTPLVKLADVPARNARMAALQPTAAVEYPLSARPTTEERAAANASRNAFAQRQVLSEQANEPEFLEALSAKSAPVTEPTVIRGTTVPVGTSTFRDTTVPASDEAISKVYLDIRRDIARQVLDAFAKFNPKKKPASAAAIQKMSNAGLLRHIKNAMAGKYGPEAKAIAGSAFKRFRMADTKTSNLGDVNSKDTNAKIRKSFEEEQKEFGSSVFRSIKDIRKDIVRTILSAKFAGMPEHAISDLTSLANTLDAITPTLVKYPVFTNGPIEQGQNYVRIGSVIISSEQSNGDMGIFLPATNEIVLFSRELNAANNPEYAISTLYHEGIAHFGLGTVFKSSADRAVFMRKVADLYKGTKLYEHIKENYDIEQMGKAAVGEEIVAFETYRLLGEGKKNIFNTPMSTVEKLKIWLRQLLIKFGLSSPTEKDVRLVIKAASQNLKDGRLNSLRSRLQTKAAMKSKGTVAQDATTVVKEKAGAVKSTVSSALDRASATKDRPAKYTNDFGELDYNFFDRVKENLQDYYHPVHFMQEAIKEKGGKISLTSNIAAIEEAIPNKLVEEMKRVDKKYVQRLLKGLSQYASVVSVSAAKAHDQVIDYLIAKHAAERNEVIRSRIADPKEREKAVAPSGMTNDKAEKILAGKEFTISKQEREMLEYIDGLMQDLAKTHIDILRKNSLLPAKEIDAIASTYKHYLPLKGWEDMMEETDKTYRSKRNRTDAALKRAAGRHVGSRPDDPILRMVMQVMDALTLAHKAETGRALLNLMEENKDTKGIDKFFFTKEEDAPMKNKWKYDSKGNLHYEVTSGFTNDPNVFTVLDNDGNKVRIRAADERVAKAFTGLNMAASLPAIQFIGRITRVLAKLSTTYNPAFILTNPIRDVMTAVVNVISETNRSDTYKISEDKIRRTILKNLKDARKTILLSTKGESVNKEWKEAFAQFRLQGGFSEEFGLKDYEVLRKEIEKSFKRPAKGQENIFEKSIGQLRSVAEYLEMQSSAFENMTRLATFKALSDAWIAKNMPAEEAHIRAAAAARNITVNFSKRGAWAPLLSPLFMFSNASIQGTTRLFRTMFRSKGAATRVLGGIVIGSFLMAELQRELGGEDDDGVAYYDKIPEWVRNNNIVLMIPGTDQYFKLPLPYGVNIFNVLGQTFSQMTHGRLDAFGSAVELFNASVDSFNPAGGSGWTSLVPTVFRPAINIGMNEGPFGQKLMPEVPTWVKYDYPDSERYWSSVNPIAKGIAQTLNMIGGSEVKPGLISISPESIEHLWESYTGGLGKTIDDVAKTAHTIVDGLFTDGKELKISDVFSKLPPFKRMYGVTNFYSTLHEYNTIKANVQTLEAEFKLAKMRGQKDAKEFLNANPKFRDLVTLKNAVDAKLRKLSKVENSVMRSTTASSESARIENIRKQKEKLIKQMIKDINKIKD